MELNLEDYEEEKWLPIIGWEGTFQVSNFGRIKRLASDTLKYNKSKLGKVFKHNTKVIEKILKQQTNRYGYRKIRTQVNGIVVSFSIHREVAKAFIVNPENKRCVNHKNGIKSDNRLENLEWVTDRENVLHAYTNGLNKAKFGNTANNFTGAVEAYDIHTKHLVCTMCGNADMKSKGFDYRLVSAVLKGKRNSHKGCYFIKINKGEALNDSSISKH